MIVSVPKATALVRELSVFFSTPLQRAIERGMKPGAELAHELSDLDEYPIRLAKDAKAICKALKQLPLTSQGEKQLYSPLHALTGLFQDVESTEVPAFQILREDGLPLLLRIFHAKLRAHHESEIDDLLFILKIASMYGSRQGAEALVEAARLPLKPDAFMWHVILAPYADHPHRDYVFKALTNPLPPDFIGIGLLDSANTAAIAGELDRHPFDSAEGYERLRAWLTDDNPSHYSYAHSATAALPFIEYPPRDQLLAIAMDHLDANIQIEAAWVAAKLGREAGLKMLARFACDVNHSDTARNYLTELGREDLIPDEATDPSFQAKADFAQWLAHPTELGQPPDELEIVDHRLLPWPPEREMAPFWLIRYRLRDRTGLEADNVDCGLVGSMTWCFFSYKMHQRPPEDAYAIHCCWEMTNAELISENEVTDAAEYAALLRHWKGSPLEQPRITRVAELSPKLDIGSRMVALASANLEGEDGWVVLDGENTAWYPKAEQPEGVYEAAILKLHIGRQLLGFDEQPDRRAWLRPGPSGPSAQSIIEAYEKLIHEAETAQPERKKELLDGWGPLVKHFDKYVDSLTATRSAERGQVLAEVYDRFLQLIRSQEEEVREELNDSLGLLDRRFEAYLDALVQFGRRGEIVPLIDYFDPAWKHNRGYGKLGAAAVKAGRDDVAEKYLLQMRDGLENYSHSEEMSLLAEVWHRRGNVQQARDLLINCLRGMVKTIQECKYNSDRGIFAKTYRHHRATYLRLFPAGEQELAALGLKPEPL